LDSSLSTLRLHEQSSVEPADYRQEKKMQALCREVATLVRQLKERDSMIHRLQSDKDEEEPASKLNALDLAQMDSKASSAMDSSTVSVSDYAELEMNLDMAERAKKDAQNKVASLTKQLADLESRYRASEAQRTALEDGLESAEQQLTAIQSQWEQEKHELEEASARDDSKVLAMTTASHSLKKEIESLEQALADSEKRNRSLLEANRRAATESQVVVARLVAEMAEMKSALEKSRAKDNKISALELDVMGARQKLERAEFRVRSLEKELDAREADMEQATRQYQQQLKMLETRIFQSEIVRRSLHNQVSYCFSVVNELLPWTDLLLTAMNVLSACPGHGVEGKYSRLLPSATSASSRKRAYWR
jgi:chromosome segregation ATPase